MFLELRASKKRRQYCCLRFVMSQLSKDIHKKVMKQKYLVFSHLEITKLIDQD